MPVQPARTEGHALEPLAVCARDHKLRDLPFGQRNLDVHYDGFVFSQFCKDKNELKNANCTQTEILIYT